MSNIYLVVVHSSILLFPLFTISLSSLSPSTFFRSCPVLLFISLPFLIPVSHSSILLHSTLNKNRVDIFRLFRRSSNSFRCTTHYLYLSFIFSSFVGLWVLQMPMRSGRRRGASEERRGRRPHPSPTRPERSDRQTVRAFPCSFWP